MSADADDELVDEQIDFYRADAAAFDDWLVTLLDPRNDEPVARNYRAGRERAARLFAERAPLGDVLEIAAGTGRLAETLLGRGGRVIFDFPDAEVSPPGRVEIPAEPTEDYGFYVPRDGGSVRDHFGRRWRVVHNLWHRAEMSSRLDDLGWNTEFVRPGLFENVVWAVATR